MAIGLQDLLNEPNPSSAACYNAATMYRKTRSAYDAKIREQAKKFKSADDDPIVITDAGTNEEVIVL